MVLQESCLSLGTDFGASKKAGLCRSKTAGLAQKIVARVHRKPLNSPQHSEGALFCIFDERAKFDMRATGSFGV